MSKIGYFNPYFARISHHPAEVVFLGFSNFKKRLKFKLVGLIQ